MLLDDDADLLFQIRGLNSIYTVDRFQVLHIDLIELDLLIKGVPVAFDTAIGETKLKDRQLGFAHEQLVQILLVGHHMTALTTAAVILPELVPVDEEVRVFGIFAVFHQVDKLR